MSVIAALRSLRQEAHKFETNLCYSEILSQNPSNLVAGAALATGRRDQLAESRLGATRRAAPISTHARRGATMFRMLSSSFEDDPFFADSFLSHRESMRNMMGSFSEPFGRNLLSVSDGRGRTHNRRDNDGEDSLTHADVNPFQTMDRMMLNMRNSMQELQRNFVSTENRLMRTLFSNIFNHT